MIKPIVIYHANCADGFTAAWCFWRKYKEEFDYHAGVYQEDPPDVKGRIVYLVDFSYKRAVVEKMVKNAEQVWLIDHHKSALEDLDNIPGLRYFTDIERSGARLAWDYLNPGQEPPRVLKHIEDRDLWKFEMPNTKEISAYVFSKEYDFAIWDNLMKASSSDLIQIENMGWAINQKHDKDIRELLKFSQRIMLIGNIDVPTANLPYTMSSEAGNIMAEGHAFAATYIDTEQYRVFSLRSAKDGMDVSIIAAQYGGGGHKHAAGFKVPRTHELATQ